MKKEVLFWQPDQVSDSLGREGSQTSTIGRAVRKDFRDSLFSIFIDNLKPEVDLRELWHFFKCFGRVRDVFLSNRFSHRRSRFAFVRFGSWEEAKLVAESVNGRLIRGWSIVSKMAAFGWKNRRSVVLRQSGSRTVDGEVCKVDGMVTGSKKGHQRMRSFAEVVTENRFKGKDECLKVPEEGISMSWDMVDKENLWLSRCTIGVLKNFTNVANMNSRLWSKGFSFKSNYLGDKHIIWRFGSVKEKIKFVSERSLWEDYFVSMNEWSDELIPKSKLVWIKCWGVPLSCWNSCFFMCLGRQLGEPVCVEEETQNRARLDRGMVLVQVPLVWICPGQINVEMGGKFFVVKIEDEQFSIEKQEELRGIIPVGRAGTLIPVEGGSVVENSEDVRRLSVDGDKATHEDSYERVGVSVSPITLKPNFENLAEMVGVNNKRRGSLGGNDAATDKFFEGVSGQERGKGPSKEKARDEVVIVGPMTEISSAVMGGAPVGVKEVPSGTPGLFQVEGSVPGSGSKSIRGRLKKHSMTLRSKQNSVLRNLEDDVAKVLEKGLALGLNFNGRKEELLDIIAKRDVMNDNRFRDLVRRLVLSYKAKGC